ncbi:MAG: Crp/Fnr family transcriptional regulator [Bacillota bacterium]
MSNSDIDFSDKLKTFKKGNIVFLEGTPAVDLYMLKSGAVELRRRFNTNELMVGTCGPGEFFGLVSAVEKWLYTETAEVTEDSEIFVLKPADLERMVVNNPAVGFRIVNYLSKQLRELDEKLEKISWK